MKLTNSEKVWNKTLRAFFPALLMIICAFIGGIVNKAYADTTTEGTMRLFINETEVRVDWEDNDSVRALRELAAGDGLTIHIEEPTTGFQTAEIRLEPIT